MADYYCSVDCQDYVRLSQLLVAYLLPSNLDGAKHVGPILKLLVQALRAKWPNVKIVFRCDGSFARRHKLNWCESNGNEYFNITTKISSNI